MRAEQRVLQRALTDALVGPRIPIVMLLRP